MKQKAAGGRPSIFIPKDGGVPIRALALTAWGTKEFERQRQRLKALAKWPGEPSDADVIEYLLRGEVRAKIYFEAKAR